MKGIHNNRFYIFFIKAFKGRLRVLFFLTFLIIIGVAGGSLNPFVYGKILDAVTTGDLGGVKTFILIYFCVNISAMLLGLLESYIGQLLSFNTVADIRRGLFAKITRMRFRSLDKYPAGELMSRLDSDGDAVVGFYVNLVTSIAMIAFNLVASVYFVFTISARLSLVAVFYIPASTAITLFFRKKFRELEKRNREYYDKYMKFINETFNNIRGIRSFRLEDESESKFYGFIMKKLGLTKRSIRLNNSMTVLSGLLSSVCSLAVIYFSAKFIIEGTLTIGSMVAFNTYADKLYNAVSRILSLNMNAQGVTVSMDRLEKLQGEEDETPLYQGKGAVAINGTINGLYVENVSFAYKDEKVLNHVTLRCAGAGVYGIVGMNGSGKSTLFKIIMGFYDGNSNVDSGSSYADDVKNGYGVVGGVKFRTTNMSSYSIADLGLTELRKRVAYVSKDIFIMDDTLLNNLKIANPALTDEKVIEICDKIKYNEFIDTLPEKYNTILGENGSRFSSGQKQKFGAVRAFLQDSDVVLLDEITSDLDGVAEAEIIGLVRELAKTRIVLFVSHKITSITDSKRIFVFDEGRVTDEGTHGELMERNALYRDLFWLEKDEGGNESEE